MQVNSSNFIVVLIIFLVISSLFVVSCSVTCHYFLSCSTYVATINQIFSLQISCIRNESEMIMERSVVLCLLLAAVIAAKPADEEKKSRVHTVSRQLSFYPWNYRSYLFSECFCAFVKSEELSASESSPSDLGLLPVNDEPRAPGAQRATQNGWRRGRPLSLASLVSAGQAE